MRFSRHLARALVLLVMFVGVTFVAMPGPAGAQQVTIAVGDFWFCDSSYQEGVCETVINAGDTVTWDFSAAITPHTTTDCGSSCDSPTASPLWDSGVVNAGGTYSFTFASAGSYPYYCAVHPTLMFGRIVVQAAAQPATQTPSFVEPGDIIPPGSTPVGGGTLPRSGSGPDGGATTTWWLIAGAIAGAGALLTTLGAAVYRRAR